MYSISVMAGDDDFIPPEEPTAERALLLESGGMSASEKTNITHGIDPI